MTPFEQGYAAFLQGLRPEMNPHDKDTCPYSRSRWDAGWLRAKADRRNK